MISPPGVTFYVALRSAPARSLLDRLERDPEPINLSAGRSVEEVEQLVERRLRYLFDRQGARVRDEQPLYPFQPEQLAARANQRTRDILDWCR